MSSTFITQQYSLDQILDSITNSQSPGAHITKADAITALSIFDANKDILFKYSASLSTEKIKVYILDGAKINSIPNFQIKSTDADATVFLAGNYDSRLRVRIFSSKSMCLMMGNTKWCKLTGEIDLRNSASMILGRGASSNDVAINISGEVFILGDDCMIGSNVEIRSHSGHSFLQISTGKRISHSTSLIIEPHCWIGSHAKIFNCPRIGGCSVIAFGAMTTRSVPRFSTAKGFPAEAKVNTDMLWLRNNNDRNLELALKALKLMQENPA